MVWIAILGTQAQTVSVLSGCLHVLEDCYRCIGRLLIHRDVFYMIAILGTQAQTVSVLSGCIGRSLHVLEEACMYWKKLACIGRSLHVLEDCYRMMYSTCLRVLRHLFCILLRFVYIQ